MVYTPGFVWQGGEWRDWQSGIPKSGAGKAGVLKAVLDEGKLTVAYDRKGAWDVHASFLGCDVVVPVGAGENAGRKLTHDFVALTYVEAAVPAFPVVMEMPRPPATVAGKLALAVWVSLRGKPAPVQAVGGWLAR